MLFLLTSNFSRINFEYLRYILWPGQAVTYKIGELKILRLLSVAKLKAGKRFDIREFHRAILDCPGSIDIWDTCINIWLDKISVEPISSEDAEIHPDDLHEENDDKSHPVKDKKGRHLVNSLMAQAFKLYKLTG